MLVAQEAIQNTVEIEMSYLEPDAHLEGPDESAHRPPRGMVYGRVRLSGF